MKRLSIGLAAVLLCCFSSSVSADIYVWTDEHGVKHFANYAPPAEAEILMQTEELPYDEQADKERIDAERQERLIAAWQDIAQKEAQLAEMQQAAERRIEEADQKTQEALDHAEWLLNEAQENNTRSFNWGYIYSGYHPYKNRHYKRWYYRKNGSIYYKSPHYKHRKGYHKKHYSKKYRQPHHGKRHYVKPHARPKRQQHLYGNRSGLNGHRSGGQFTRNGRSR